MRGLLISGRVAARVVRCARVAQTLELSNKSKWVPPDVMLKPPVLNATLAEILSKAEKCVPLLWLLLLLLLPPPVARGGGGGGDGGGGGVQCSCCACVVVIVIDPNNSVRLPQQQRRRDGDNNNNDNNNNTDSSRAGLSRHRSASATRVPRSYSCVTSRPAKPRRRRRRRRRRRSRHRNQANDVDEEERASSGQERIRPPQSHLHNHRAGRC